MKQFIKDFWFSLVLAAAVIISILMFMSPAYATLSAVKGLDPAWVRSCMVFDEGRPDVEVIISNLKSNFAYDLEMTEQDNTTIVLTYTMPEQSMWVGEFTLVARFWEEHMHLGVACLNTDEETAHVLSLDLFEYMVGKMEESEGDS